jgi:hypothetical protein
VGKVKLGIPVGHQTSDVLGKQAKVFPGTKLDSTVFNFFPPQPPEVVAAMQPSPQGAGSLHEVPPPESKPVSCGTMNDKKFTGRDPALGDNEPLSVAKSVDRPSDEKVPDPGAV